MIWVLGLVLALWLIYWRIMSSPSAAHDVLSKIGGAFDLRLLREGTGNEQAISLLFLLATDVVAGVGLRSALRSFLRSHAPLIEFSTGFEVDVPSLERPDKPARRPILLSLPSGGTRQAFNVAPLVVEVKGLKNRGQTCFANSVMQALASLEPFYNYLGSMQQNACSDCNGQENVSSALFDTLQFINGHQVFQTRSKTRSLLPFGLFSSSSRGDPQRVMNTVAKHHSQFRSRNNLGMAGIQEQQDSHEFFSALLDVLSSEEQGEGTVPITTTVRYAGSGLACCDRFESKCDLSGADACQDKRREELAVPGGQSSNVRDSFTDEQEEEEKKHDDEPTPGQHTPGRSSISISNHATREDVHPKTEERRSTPHNPFDGWAGSTIKCARCKHIRPIRSTPFLGLSLPIASIKSEYVEDFLASEYGGFGSAERVSDVQCFSCAIQQNLREVEEEDMLLSGAISSIQRRSKGRQNAANGSGEKKEDAESDIAGLLQESRQLKRNIAILKALDPDADEDKLECKGQGGEEDEIDLGIGTSLPPIVPLRGDAYKASLVMRPPQVLCIHIQRRHYDASSHGMVKISRHVKFEEELDLSPYCEFGGNSFERQRAFSTNAKIPYRLMSVVEHLGNAFGGHYQTYRRVDTKQQQQHEWALVSDERVSYHSWNEVRKCQAYMLFYVATSSTEAGQGLGEEQATRH